MSRLNDTGLTQAYLWIFEHAYKYNMDSVIESILQKYEAFKFVSNILENLNDEAPPSVHPDFLFEFFLKDLSNSLNVENQHNKEFPAKINFDLLNLVIDLLEHIYRKEIFMNFRNFINLVSRLKLLEVICRIYKKESEEIVHKRLDTLFPKWDNQFELFLMNKFELSRVDELKSMRKTHLGIRDYILQLLSSSDKREIYFLKNYKTDVTDILNFAKKQFKDILIETNRKILHSETAIEKIKNGGWKDLNNIDDLAIRILLKRINSGTDEKNLQKTVNMLKRIKSVTPKKKFNSKSFDSIKNGKELDSVEKVKMWLEPIGKYYEDDIINGELESVSQKRKACKRHLIFNYNRKSSEIVDCSSLDSKSTVSINFPKLNLQKPLPNTSKKICRVEFYKRGVIECNGENYQLYS